ncbi:MAG: Rrf2 family transcriptional regulator [Candidatus Omnitrophica bacterium]|nr:Rrf2 family transcriptional regulator [Candidatus Omnitrophota bacterium]
MMRASKKLEYGLRAMADLASYYKDGPVSAKNISGRQNIPLQYLEQILNRLKRARLIETVRGPKGGYALSKEPVKVKMSNIFVALGDRGYLVACLGKKSSTPCSRMAMCNTRVFWEKLNKSMAEVLNSMSLQDLCDNKKGGKRVNKIEHSYPFQI